MPTWPSPVDRGIGRCLAGDLDDVAHALTGGLAPSGYFEGSKHLPAPNSGNILSCTFDSGWFWYVPLTQH
jgi:hypothetical protein